LIRHNAAIAKIRRPANNRNRGSAYAEALRRDRSPGFLGWRREIHRFPDECNPWSVEGQSGSDFGRDIRRPPWKIDILT